MNRLNVNIATAFHLILIAAVGALIYSNTLTGTFQFDDKINIVDNPYIRDIGNLWPPTGTRWFGLLTFSLNYMADGLNPFGYHLVNLVIHILTALSVYLLIRLTFRTPYFSNYNANAFPENIFALVCALLFVAHPIQTQAVSYIVQRFASLAALLFVLSLDCYILARLKTISWQQDAPGSKRFHVTTTALYTAAAFFGLLSLLTKENACTLPLVAVMYDGMFMGGGSQICAGIRKRWRTAAAISALSSVILVFFTNRYGMSLFERLKATNEISRHDYLITQFRVIVTYLRLLFVPVNQSIDYRYKVYSELFNPEIAASLALIVCLIITAAVLFRTSRHGNPYLRLVSFGIFWFFITLSIESGLIPIADVMFEHRLYLPITGAIIAVIALTAYSLAIVSRKHVQVGRIAACLFIVVIVALSIAAYQRNRVWKNELTLWTDVIDTKPLNPRGYNMVGSYYQANFRIYDAIGYFRKALEVDSSYAEARSNLGNAYIQVGRLDEGLKELMITAQNNRFDEIDTGILYLSIGRALYRKGQIDPAIENLMTALRYNPNEPALHFLLGEIYQHMNLPEKSSEHLKKAHELNPDKY